MNAFVKIILLSWLCALSFAMSAQEESKVPQQEVVATSIRNVVEVDSTTTVPDDDTERLKRQLPNSSPVFYDNVPTTAQQPQQTSGLISNLPIIGTLVGNIPGVTGQGGLISGLPQTLNGLTNGLGLGNLIGLGNLGSLGNLAGLGGLGSTGGISSSVASCPLTQRLTCRCETVIPVGTRRTEAIEIVKQSSKRNEDGTREISADLNNGLRIYQRTGTENGAVGITQGFYSLKLAEQRYLTIHYTVNVLDYTIKADVTQEPPKLDLDSENYIVVDLQQQ